MVFDQENAQVGHVKGRLGIGQNGLGRTFGFNGFFKRQINAKATAHMELAGDSNFAPQALAQMLTNGQTQSGAAVQARNRGVGLHEGLE